MTNFSRFVLGLLAVLTLTIIGFRTLSHTRSPNLALLFTNPDGSPCQRPCLFGIQPGQTSYTQAVALLRTHPLTHALRLYGMRNVFSAKWLTVIVSLEADDRVSSVMLISTSDSSPVAGWATLGQVIALLGEPSPVKFGGGHLTSYYPNDHIIFSHRGDPVRLTCHEPLEEMSVYQVMPEPTPEPDTQAQLNNLDCRP